MPERPPESTALVRLRPPLQALERQDRALARARSLWWIMGVLGSLAVFALPSAAVQGLLGGAVALALVLGRIPIARRRRTREEARGALRQAYELASRLEDHGVRALAPSPEELEEARRALHPARRP